MAWHKGSAQKAIPPHVQTPHVPVPKPSLSQPAQPAQNGAHHRATGVHGQTTGAHHTTTGAHHTATGAHPSGVSTHHAGHHTAAHTTPVSPATQKAHKTGSFGAKHPHMGAKSTPTIGKGLKGIH